MPSKENIFDLLNQLSSDKYTNLFCMKLLYSLRPKISLVFNLSVSLTKHYNIIEISLVFI